MADTFCFGRDSPLDASARPQLLPFFASERKNNMFQIQYATKLGRKLYSKKLVAVTLASIMGTTLLIGSVFGLYLLLNRTTTFFPNLVWASWGENFLRYEITFLQYILLTIGLVYLLGLIFAYLAFFISRISPNHLTAIAIGIPVIVVFEIFLSRYVIRNILSIWLHGALSTLILVYTGLLIVTIMTIVIQNHREKRIDILN